MKIEASRLQPGMVVNIGNKKYKHICLVTAVEGFVEVEYTHFDAEDPYWGQCVGTISGKKLVKVLTGKKRKSIIQNILDEVFKRLHDVEKDKDTIYLIQAMSK